MKNLFVFLFFTFHFLLFTPLWGQDTAIINLSRKATIEILLGDESGRVYASATGFFVNINNNIYILTCFHVVHGMPDKYKADSNNTGFETAPFISGVLWTGDTIELGIMNDHKNISLHIYKDIDFAVLRPRHADSKLKEVKALTISDKPDYIGERIYFSGFPMPSVMLTEAGSIAGIDSHKIYFQPACMPGASGGALLNETGAVIGIVMFKPTEYPQKISKGMPGYVYDLINRMAETGIGVRNKG